MVRREHLSPKKRAELFKAKNGICHLCKGKVQAGEAWEVSHPIPLELGGPDDDTNRDVAHRKCHAAETKKDIADIAKAKRREQRNIGIRRRSKFQNARGGRFKTRLTSNGPRTELR